MKTATLQIEQTASEQERADLAALFGGTLDDGPETEWPPQDERELAQLDAWMDGREQEYRIIHDAAIRCAILRRGRDPAPRPAGAGGPADRQALRFARLRGCLRPG